MMDELIQTTTHEGLQRSAEHVVNHMQRILHITLRYDLASMQWLDGYIERNRRHIDTGDEMRPTLVYLFGAYYGESVVREYRGQWAQPEVNGQWVVNVGKNGWVNPFVQVESHLLNGAVDSIARAFSVIPAQFNLTWYHGV